jgi:dihydrofolate reductase
MSIIFLVAIANNGVIGYKGKLPWHYPEDLRRFKKITMGSPVVMGRKTWESLPTKPLKGRTNIVLTKNSDFQCPDAHVYDNLQNIIWDYRGCENIYVIGGAQIFTEYLDFADVLEITHIHKDFDGDVYFPCVSPKIWYTARMKRSNELLFATYERI